MVEHRRWRVEPRHGWRFFRPPSSILYLPASAFTLVEVVLVAVVLAILLTITVPRFQQAAQRFQMERTAVDLTQLLRYAHERAVAQGEAVAWVWEPESQRARLAIITDSDYQWLAERQARSERLQEGFSLSLLRDGTQPVEAVTFFPDGTSDAVTVQLASPQDVYTITVDATTSHVALSAGSLTR